MANDEKWISKQKAARRLDCSEKAIDRLRARGELAAIRLGIGQTARVRIEIASLENYEARQGARRSQPEPRRERRPIPALDAIRAAKAYRRANGRRPAPRLEAAA
jgi:hypothetical protein